MGRVRCGNHGGHGPVCCWKCDRCPKCDGVTIGRGDYCNECRQWFIDNGYVWSAYSKDFVKKDTASGRLFAA